MCLMFVNCSRITVTMFHDGLPGTDLHDKIAALLTDLAKNAQRWFSPSSPQFIRLMSRVCPGTCGVAMQSRYCHDILSNIAEMMRR